jgi:hypothetical protein
MEPPRFPAKSSAEMQLLASGVVTPRAVFLQIWFHVLRDVTVLASPLGWGWSVRGLDGLARVSATR